MEYTKQVIQFAPNPASSWSEIEYTLPAGYNKAELVITNTLGINVLEMELSDNQGRKTLDIDNVPSGVYTYFVKCGEFVKTGKLVNK